MHVTRPFHPQDGGGFLVDPELHRNNFELRDEPKPADPRGPCDSMAVNS